jgi:hypothetical protein
VRSLEGDPVEQPYTDNKRSDQHEPQAEGLAREALVASWDFSKIPVFSSGRAEQFQMPPLFPAPHLLGPLQAKLKVGAVNDPLEHEADRVAEQVMRMPAAGIPLTSAPPRISSKCAECEEEEKLQKKPAGTAEATSSEAPSIVHEVLRSPGQPLDATPGDVYEQEADRIANQVMATPGYSAVSGAPPRIQHFSAQSNGQMDAALASVDQAFASPGRPLEPELRQDMEQRFGYDFSAQDLNAHAYTVGADVVFGASRFAPETHEGRRLIAHKLAHALQQGVAAEQVTMGDLRVAQQNDPFKHEAERVSISVLSGRVGGSSEKPPSVSVRPDGQPTLRRQPSPDAGTHDPEPLHTLPPKEERRVTTLTSAQSACKFPSDIALPCSPKGVSNDDFLKTGAPKEALGVTIIPIGAKFSVPEVRTKPVAKDGKQVVIQSTKATPAPCQSIFTKAGHFLRVVPIHANDPEQLADKCGSSYLGKFNLVPAGEKRIIKAEMEHCTDYKYAFDISLGCYAAVVNDLAKTKKVFPSHEDAVDAVTKSTGQEPVTWGDHYLKLIAKSDDRDTKNWHKPIWQGQGLFVELKRSGRCESTTEAEINGKSYPEVDKHQTPDVIKL